MRRPAFSLALAFCGGILSSQLFGTDCILASAACATCCAFMGAVIPQAYPSTILILSAAFFTGIFTYSCHENSLNHSELRRIFGSRCVRVGIRGILLQPASLSRVSQKRNRFPYKARSVMRVTHVESSEGWHPAQGRIRVTLLLDKPVDLVCGDLVQMNGTLRRMREATNPGQFDSRSFWHRRGIDYLFVVKGSSQIKRIGERKRKKLICLLEAVRVRLRKSLELGMPDCPARRVIAAMILGYRENIGEDVTKTFRSTNTLHILAISGLHVGFVYLLMHALLKVILFPRRFHSLIAIPVIAVYAAMTGARPPVVRASVMFVILLIAPLLGRRRDMVNSLGIAAMAILVVNPLQLYETGFQLSFIAVLSILCISGPIEGIFFNIFPCKPFAGQLHSTSLQKLRWWIGKKGIVLLSTSLAAWIGLAPVIARSFNVFTPLGIAGNLVVIPAGFAIVCLGFLAMACSFFCPALTLALNCLNWLIATFMLLCLRGIAKIPYACLHVATPSALQLGSCYGLIFVVSLLFLKGGVKKVKSLMALTAAILFVLPFAFSHQKPVLKIYFLDVWEGDATYLEFPGGENLLIDGGPEEGFPAGKMVLSPFLRSRGRGSLDTVLLTHPHLDHISGLFTVLEEASIERMVVAGWHDSSMTYRRLLQLAGKKGIPVYVVKRGDYLARGDALEISVLNPGRYLHRQTRSDLNNNSVALLVRYGNVRILICADMEREAEEELCRSGMCVDADVLRTGHHGGVTSSNKEFLRRVSPRWAIISAGRNNRFGHPAADVLVRLREEGIKVFRTDVHGAIMLTTDGRDIAIEAFR
jgi:competence protein ComEC